MSAVFHWWNQNQNGRAVDVLASLRVLEDMKTTTTGQENVVGRPQGTVVAHAGANTPARRADPRQWTVCPALNSIPAPTPPSRAPGTEFSVDSSPS